MVDRGRRTEHVRMKIPTWRSVLTGYVTGTPPRSTRGLAIGPLVSRLTHKMATPSSPSRDKGISGREVQAIRLRITIRIIGIHSLATLPPTEVRAFHLNRT